MDEIAGGGPQSRGTVVQTTLAFIGLPLPEIEDRRPGVGIVLPAVRDPVPVVSRNVTLVGGAALSRAGAFSETRPLTAKHIELAVDGVLVDPGVDTAAVDDRLGPLDGGGGAGYALSSPSKVLLLALDRAGGGNVQAPRSFVQTLLPFVGGPLPEIEALFAAVGIELPMVRDPVSFVSQTVPLRRGGRPLLGRALNH